jgi:thiamine-monophosphate kinase
MGRSYNGAVNGGRNRELGTRNKEAPGGSVGELGEFGLIERLAAVVGAEVPADLILGIGDDAAAWWVGEQVLLATTDTLVEGVHFLPEFAPWVDVGWKALAVNVSDIAAMGGEPLFALVTLALPPGSEVAFAEELYGGLMECAREYGVTVAGGDVVRAPQVSVTVALIGRAQMREGEPLLMRRDGAKAGDVIAVTGTLGDSAAGLWRLRKGRRRRTRSCACTCGRCRGWRRGRRPRGRALCARSTCRTVSCRTSGTSARCRALGRRCGRRCCR